jgi:hypothetical protein
MKTNLVLAGKVEDRGRRGDRTGTGYEGTSRAGAGCDVLHDVEPP